MDDLKKFSKLFWFLGFCLVVIYFCTLSFNNISTALLTEYWLGEDDDEEAGLMVSSMWLVVILGLPTFGYVVDKFG